MLLLVILVVCGQSKNSTYHIFLGPKLEISFSPNFAILGGDTTSPTLCSLVLHPCIASGPIKLVKEM